MQEIIKKSLLGLVIGIGLSGNSLQASFWPKSLDGRSVIKGIITTGVTCLGIIGVYKLGSYLFKRSDQRVINDAHDAYQRSLQAYGPMLTLIEGYNEDNKSFMYEVNQQLLYQLAMEKFYKEPIASYLSNLNRALRTLKSEYSTLEKRMKILAQKEYETSIFLYRQMEGIAQKLAKLIPNIEQLHLYLSHHKGYFTLFETETVLLNYYGRELNSLKSYDQNLIYQEINTCIMMRHAENKSRFPFLHYAHRLNRDLKKLHNTINSLAYNYFDRISAARELETNLNTIRGIVLASQTYHYELDTYEKEKLEREQLAAQQAQVAIQLQQAQALMKQNKLKEEQNQLKREELYKREEKEDKKNSYSIRLKFSDT